MVWYCMVSYGHVDRGEVYLSIIHKLELCGRNWRDERDNINKIHTSQKKIKEENEHNRHLQLISRQFNQ